MTVTDKKKQGFDNAKLRGRIIEKSLRNKDVAEKIGISETSFSYKLTGKSDFTHSELVAICAILEIPFEEIPLYFFT